jgi:hypothetical protein
MKNTQSALDKACGGICCARAINQAREEIMMVGSPLFRETSILSTKDFHTLKKWGLYVLTG